MVGSRPATIHHVDRDGTQVVGRVAMLLRFVTSAEGGVTTAETVAATGLTRTTAHRLLSALAREGLLDSEPGSGRWHAGPELFVLGRVATGRFDVVETARPLVRSLAARTGESAFLSVRRGDETVCLLREEGSFPVRSHVLHEGIRFPLGVASAGLVLLAFSPAADVDDFLRRHPDLGTEFPGHTETPLRRRLRETTRRGFAVNPGLLVEGSWGLAAPVFDRAGEAVWALTLTGIQSRLSGARQRELGGLLLDHAHELTGRLSRGGR